MQPNAPTATPASQLIADAVSVADGITPDAGVWERLDAANFDTYTSEQLDVLLRVTNDALAETDALN